MGLSAALASATAILGEMGQNKNTSSGDKTFYSAESALEEGAYQYLHNQSYIGGSFPLVNGSHTDSILIEDLGWPYAKVKGGAENYMTSRIAVNVITVFAEGEAFNYATYSEENLTLSGNTTINGNVFTNGDMEFNGNSSEINGDAFAAGTIDGGNISGAQESGMDPIPPPQIDAAPYKTLAESAGTYFDDANDAEDWFDFNDTGLIFVDDLTNETHLTNSASLLGTLAATGDIKLSGGTYTVANTDYPAILVEGDLEIAGGAVINGLVYVRGATTFGAGNNIINGALISVGGVTDLFGNTTINFEEDYVANWQDLDGLDINSSEDPKILNWGEE